MNSELDEFYQTHFGDRWNATLKPALMGPVEQVSIDFDESGLTVLPKTDGCYSLDPASLEPVRALALEPDLAFLDLCAAPGGKALAALMSVKGQLRAHLNDSSNPRVQRLKAILHDFLPAEVVPKIRVTCADGARFGGRAKEQFDRVLADVPCSSERHHLLDGSEKTWSRGKSKGLSVRQHAILCSAVDATKPGGRIVYSTCSLSPLENDGVIKKLLKSRSGQVEVLSLAAEIGERTEFGRLILPDRVTTAGPIYYVVIKKL